MNNNIRNNFLVYGPAMIEHCLSFLVYGPAVIEHCLLEAGVQPNSKLFQQFKPDENEGTTLISMKDYLCVYF